MKNIKIKVNITDREEAILNYAINECKGEIIEPANDDDSYMDTLCNMYRKHLIRLDFKRDKLFVSDIGRGLLCI